MKAEKTTQYILEKVSPLFNKKGYVGTSMSEITKAVGMTKGAIYGNFENKESLAISSFEYNVRTVIFPLFEAINSRRRSLDKLWEITAYYRKYYKKVEALGGCPLLRVGIDAKFHNPLLFEMSKEITDKLIESLRLIIEQGIKDSEIKPGVDTSMISRNIFSIIEGSVFMALTHLDENYLTEAMDHIDEHIINRIKK